MIDRTDVLIVGSYPGPRSSGRRPIVESGRALLTWILVVVIAVAFATSISLLLLGL
jgi:hypothetical protein